MADCNTSSLLTVQPHLILTAKAKLFASLKCQTPLRVNSPSTSNSHTLPSHSCDIHAACDKSFVENPGLESAVCDSALMIQDSENISHVYNNNIAIEGVSVIGVSVIQVRG